MPGTAIDRHPDHHHNGHCNTLAVPDGKKVRGSISIFFMMLVLCGFLVLVHFKRKNVDDQIKTFISCIHGKRRGLGWRECTITIDNLQKEDDEVSISVQVVEKRVVDPKDLEVN